ncbi:MAG: hypothetical protein AAGG53_10295, partial [Cyanobacteria bacterium P01_H01_bin.152]
FSWPTPLKLQKQSRSRLFGGLIACSLLAHGLLLGLPWPAVEFSQEAMEPPPDPESVMDVAILPSETLPPPANEESTLAEPPANPATEAPSSAVAPSSESDPIESTAPPPELNPNTPPTLPVTEPPLSSNSIDGLPSEPGSANLSETNPITPPTLQERLQDVTAYEHDGTKNLGDDAFIIAQAWAVAGQPFPAKADVMQLPYELGETCLNNPPLRGTLMIVVDATGHFMRGPEVISSTGYSILDEQAKAMMQSREYTLSNPDEPRAYSVDIEVLYPHTCS